MDWLTALLSIIVYCIVMGLMIRYGKPKIQKWIANKQEQNEVDNLDLLYGLVASILFIPILPQTIACIVCAAMQPKTGVIICFVGIVVGTWLSYASGTFVPLAAQLPVTPSTWWEVTFVFFWPAPPTTAIAAGFGMMNIDETMVMIGTLPFAAVKSIIIIFGPRIVPKRRNAQ